MKRLLTALSVFVFVVSIAGFGHAQSDPRIGTWKLNVAKSKSDAPARKSETRTYTSSGDMISMQTDVVNNDGSKQSYGYKIKPDGKDYPYTGTGPGGATTIAEKHMGQGFMAEQKKDGKLLFTAMVDLSDDGKQMTITVKGMDAMGKSANAVRVYDKQ